jgi:selenide,water dikinase
LESFIDEEAYPDLIAGLAAPDDAAVWRLDADRALVVTTDFFTPIVDDPFDYGAIAAANSLSDIYAMGGKPFMALNVSAFPPNLPSELLSRIIAGGAEVAKQAGAVIVGGHTIQDKEPKYGLVALGFAHPDHILRKGGAQVGDVMLLSKPLGTGTITTALKQEKVEKSHLENAVRWMRKLNAAACDAALDLDAHAATDVTGFSLMGHAWEMAQASGLGLKIKFSSIPLLDGAAAYARSGIFPGGAFDNKAYFQSHVTISVKLTEGEELLLYDPQTSGGLLVAVDPEKWADAERKGKYQTLFNEIGTVVDDSRIIIE